MSNHNARKQPKRNSQCVCEGQGTNEKGRKMLHTQRPLTQAVRYRMNSAIVFVGELVLGLRRVVMGKAGRRAARPVH